MFCNYDSWKLGVLIVGISWAVAGSGGPVIAGQDLSGDVTPQDSDLGAGTDGVQVQTRGSVHEAFAEPVVYDPGPGPVVPTEPPQPIEEQPPDQKPEGDDIQWIAGYWSWDQDCGNCGNYIWVSGIWRLPPPGHHWVPGYWNQVNGGWQWAPGVWMTVDPADAEYLPTPPASVEAGPIGDPLAADSIWSPGCWHWTESRYAWRPGFWVAFQPNWSWVPDHYAWTPGGSLFVEGYWDYPLARRGVLYAPVCFPSPALATPNFVYSPSVCIPAATLVSCLFVQPSCHQYCFGDYFGASNFQAGIYPWYAFHQSRYGYDPIYSHYSAVHCRDKGWSLRLHEEYRYRRDNPAARPPRLLAGQDAYRHGPASGKFPPLAMTASIHQLMKDSHQPIRVERLSADRRQGIARQANELHQFGQRRRAHETTAANRSPLNGQHATTPKLAGSPTGATIPKSQIAMSRTQNAQRPSLRAASGNAPPSTPTHPALDHGVRPLHPDQAPRRPDPHPNLPPVEHRTAGHPGYGLPREVHQSQPPVRRAATGSAAPHGQKPRPGPRR